MLSGAICPMRRSAGAQRPRTFFRACGCEGVGRRCTRVWCTRKCVDVPAEWRETGQTARGFTGEVLEITGAGKGQ